MRTKLRDWVIETRIGQLTLMSALFVASIAAMGLAASPILAGSKHHLPVLRSLSRSAGEAGLIAWLLAVIVDPILKTRLFRTTGRGLWWAIFSREAPDNFRKALEALANLQQFYERTVWDLEFAWEVPDEILQIKIAVRSYGFNVDRAGYAPTARRWVMASVIGYESTYDYWSIEVPTLTETFEYQRGEPADGKTQGEEDGSLYAVEDVIAPDLVVPQNERYVTLRKVTIYLSARDVLPLVHTLTSVRQQITLGGSALPDLHVRVRPTSQGPIPGQQSDEPHVAPEQTERYLIEHVTFPGQSTLVTWQPKARTNLATPPRPFPEPAGAN